MSNFFGALESDDEEPTRVNAGKKGAGASSEATKPSAAGERLTGAEKKNRDQKRHGATRGAKKGDSDKKHGGFDRKSGSGRSGGQSKDGRGKFAFGSAAADAEEAEKDPGAAIAALDISEDEAEVVAEEEPAAPTMSMEDFLAQRSAEKAALSKLAGNKKERKVQTEGETRQKKTESALLDATVEAKEQGPKGLSKRLQAKQEVSGIKFGFKLGNEEDRPPRRDFDSSRKQERPARRDGDGNGNNGKRDFKSRGGRGDGDKPRRNRTGPNLGDINAFPAL
jgi:hypothetical protein